MKRSVRPPAFQDKSLRLSGHRVEKLLKSFWKGCDSGEIGSHIWVTAEERAVRSTDLEVENRQTRSVNKWERDMALPEAQQKICPRRSRMGCGVGKGIWQ